MFLYPPIQPASVYHVHLPTHSTSIYPVYLPTQSPRCWLNHVSLPTHPSVSTTYLPISTISLCTLSPIHLPVSTSYLSICHLPNPSIRLRIYLSCIHASSSPTCLSLYLSMCLWLRFSTGDDRAPQSTYDEAWRHFFAVRTRARGVLLTPRGRSSEMLLHTPQHTEHNFLPLKNDPGP